MQKTNGFIAKKAQRSEGTKKFLRFCPIVLLFHYYSVVQLANASDDSVFSSTGNAHTLDEGTTSKESIECSTSTPDLQKMSQSSDCELVHVDFEVYGEVQGVFFRKYTQKQASQLNLRGFCRNTRSGTVSGSMEGPRQAIDQMKHWLSNTGSPQSRISNAVFKNEKSIDAFSLPSKFEIARTV